MTGVDGDGVYDTTVGFASNATGVWHWAATYDGDSNNGSPCPAALAMNR